MKTIIFSILLLSSLGAHAETREWTTEEKAWGAVTGTLLLADWSTSQNMSRRYNEGYYERNPLLGQHPSSNTINLYFLIATPLIFLAADQVPEYRKTILQATSLVELVVVGNNLRLGLHFQF
jgi:hypothetical protein